MGDDVSVFDAALRETHGRLLNLHLAAMGTLEAELQRMREENTALRLRLVEAGLSMHGPAAAAAAPTAGKMAGSEGRPVAFASIGVPASLEASKLGGPAGETVSGNQATLEPEGGGICVGTRVRLHSLRSAPKMNGLEGTCSHWDANSSRWVIRFACGDERALRSENLEELLDSPVTSSGSSSSAEAQEGRTLPTHAYTEPVVVVATPCVEEPEEIVTEGAAAEQAAADVEAGEAVLYRVLLDALANLGVTDTEALGARSCGNGAWVIGGVPVLLHLDEQPGSVPAVKRLKASVDAGRSWDLFTDVFQRHAGQAPHAQAVPQAHAQRQPHVPSQHVYQQQPHHYQQPQAAAPQPQARQAWPNGFVASSPGVRFQDATSPGSHERPYSFDSRGQVETQRGMAQEVHFADEEPPPEPQGVLPEWRNDGLPTFNRAFPASFDARGGQKQYYSNFRVRVPTTSQYP